jgi:glycerophosphoryl diester phosphodiesterase
MTQALFDFLEKNNLETIQKATDNGIPIIVQSFSENALKEFATLSDLPRVQLLRTDQYLDIPHISTYAHGVGPDSKYVMYWPDMDMPELFDPTTSSPFVNEMHSNGLQVHPYTLRIDDRKYMSTPAEEIALYATKGCDGVFTEFVSTTLTVWDQMYPTSNRLSNY